MQMKCKLFFKSLSNLWGYFGGFFFFSVLLLLLFLIIDVV